MTVSKLRNERWSLTISPARRSHTK